jgi:hypothetical protein
MARSAPAADWLRRHPSIAAALVYLVLSGVLYAPGLLPGHTLSASDYLWSAAPWDAGRPADIPFLGSNYELVDSATQSQQWLDYNRHHVFDPPLWNPYVGGGRPYFANAQSALLSPFSLPAYLLPFWWSLGIVSLLKVFTAAFGTYLLGRALGMRFPGALLAGLVFAFSLYFLVWVTWPLPNVWAWLPWLLLLTEMVIRRPSLIPVLGLAAVVAVQFFGGHPESNFHLLGTAVVFFAFRLVVLRRDGAIDSLRPRLLAFAGGLALGTALAALLLIPFLELLFRSGDVDVRANFWQISLPRRYLLGFALYDYWGRSTHVALANDFSQVRALYVGALPLALGAAALVIRPTLQRLGVALFGAAMLATVLGIWPFPELARHIPVVKTGNSLRASVILMLCLALLSGWGLDDLVEGRVARRNVVLGIAAALLVMPVVVLAARGDLSASLLGDALKIAWGFSWPQPPANGDTILAIRMASLIVWLSFMGLALALLAARLR